MGDSGRKFFMSLRDLELRVRQKRDNLEHLKALAVYAGIDYAKPYVKEHAENARSNLLAELVSAQDAFEKEAAKLSARRRKAQEILDALPPRTSLVMHLRYLECLTWEKTAEQAGLSPQWCQELNKRGLEASEKFFRT